MSCSLKVTQYIHVPASQLYGLWMSVPKVLVARRKILKKNFGSPLRVLYSANLCFFDKLQPIIAQLDPVLFASDNNHMKRSKYGSINSPRCPVPWFVYILMHGREEWVLISLGSEKKCVELPVRPVFSFLVTMLIIRCLIFLKLRLRLFIH